VRWSDDDGGVGCGTSGLGRKGVVVVGWLAAG
jgi:hypothetical protein